jgi:hypothetical protein
MRQSLVVAYLLAIPFLPVIVPAVWGLPLTFEKLVDLGCLVNNSVVGSLSLLSR